MAAPTDSAAIRLVRRVEAPSLKGKSTAPARASSSATSAGAMRPVARDASGRLRDERQELIEKPFGAGPEQDQLEIGAARQECRQHPLERRRQKLTVRSEMSN